MVYILILCAIFSALARPPLSGSTIDIKSPFIEQEKSVFTEGLYMFKEVSKSLTRTDIAEIEVNLGLAFPEDFVAHYLSYNGGRPTKPFFYSEEEDIETEIQVFLPLKHHYCDIPIRTAEENYLLFKGKSSLMTSYFPFANDYGANPICVNLENGGVYIVHMDLGKLEDRCFHRLAESFRGFLEALSEDSIDD